MTTLERTRQHFIDLDIACIQAALDGTDKVNNLHEYIAWRQASIAATMRGENDYTFTFRQYAHYLDTGDCVALLPN